MVAGTGSHEVPDVGLDAVWEDAKVTAPKHSKFVSIVSWSGILAGFFFLLPSVQCILKLSIGVYRYNPLLIPRSGLLDSLSLGFWALLSLGFALACWFGGRWLRERQEKGRKMMSAMLAIVVLLGLFALPGWYREVGGLLAFWGATWLGLKIGLWGLSIFALIKLQSKSVVRECNYVFRATD